MKLFIILIVLATPYFASTQNISQLKIEGIDQKLDDQMSIKRLMAQKDILLKDLRLDKREMLVLFGIIDIIRFSGADYNNKKRSFEKVEIIYSKIESDILLYIKKGVRSRYYLLYNF